MDIPSYHTFVYPTDIVNIVSDVNPFPLARAAGLTDPKVLIRSLLLKFIVVDIKIHPLIREDIRIWYDIESFMSMLLLHIYNVLTQRVFSSDFIAAWEVVDLLVLIQPFVDIRISTRDHPQDIPIVRFCVPESISFQHRSDELGISFQKFINQLS